MSKDTTVTFRTNKEMLNEAKEIFSDLGINMSVAINMFLVQTVKKRTLPIDMDLFLDAKSTYPPDFFSLYGSGSADDMPPIEELDMKLDGKVVL